MIWNEFYHVAFFEAAYLDKIVSWNSDILSEKSLGYKIYVAFCLSLIGVYVSSAS